MTFGYLAGLTTSLELVTGVIILPQRQAVLVAKQAAEVDLLSGGRLRLGVGIGWNAVEYEALAEEFKTRAKRFEEQIELMRLLWTQRSVTYSGSLGSPAPALRRCRCTTNPAVDRCIVTTGLPAGRTAGRRVVSPDATRPGARRCTRPGTARGK